MSDLKPGSGSAVVALRAPIDNRQFFASEGATLSGINQ